MDNTTIIGSNLKRLREYYGYTQKSIAWFLDVNQNLYSEFEAGERNMSVDMLERLAILFGVPKDSFIEDDFEISDENQTFRASNNNDNDLKVIYVLSKMYENIKNMDDLMSNLEEDNDMQSGINKIIASIKMDERTKAEVIRNELGLDITSPIDIKLIISSLNYVTIVFYPMGDKLRGMSIKDNKNLVVGINSQLAVGTQSFLIAHELYNSYFGDKNKSISYRNNYHVIENESKADKFAAYFLIPFHSLYHELLKRKIEKPTLEDIIALEQFYRVSRKVILYRLVIDNIITREEADAFANTSLSSVILQGYDDTLYRPLPKEKQFRTLGKYIRQANILYQNELISNGKYEELLLDAFRSDIVYGEGIQINEIID